MADETFSLFGLPSDAPPCCKGQENQLFCRWRNTRPAQLSILHSLIRSHSPCPPLFLFGPPSTGKSSLVLDILRFHACPHVYLDCSACTSERALFNVLNQQLLKFHDEGASAVHSEIAKSERKIANPDIFDQEKRMEQEKQTKIKEKTENERRGASIKQRIINRGKAFNSSCSSVSIRHPLFDESYSSVYRDRYTQLVYLINSIPQLFFQTLFIVLDHSDRAYQINTNFLNCLFALEQQTRKNITIIMIQPAPLTCEQALTLIKPNENLIYIPFTPYETHIRTDIVTEKLWILWNQQEENNEEKQAIPPSQLNSLCPRTLFRSWIAHITDITDHSTRDLLQLEHIIRLLYGDFLSFLSSQAIQQRISLVDKQNKGKEKKEQNKKQNKENGENNKRKSSGKEKQMDEDEDDQAEKGEEQRQLMESAILAALFSHQQPLIRAILQNLFHPEVTEEEIRSLASMESNSSSSSSSAPLPSSPAFLSHTLPVAARYLLIAAFLASHNSHHSDTKLFYSLHSGGRKRQRVARVGGLKDFSAGRKVSSLLIGPKFFPQSRLLAIYYCLIADSESSQESLNALSGAVYSQLSNLILWRLLIVDKSLAVGSSSLSSSYSILARANGEWSEEMKFKCNVQYEAIQAMAKSVKLELKNYLAVDQTSGGTGIKIQKKH
jgi:hypothetical protein